MTIRGAVPGPAPQREPTPRDSREPDSGARSLYEEEQAYITGGSTYEQREREANARADIQPTDDTDYTRPFGVASESEPEDKAAALGFKDPRIVIPPPWSSVRPTRLQKIKKWIRHNIFRQRR